MSYVRRPQSGTWTAGAPGLDVHGTSPSVDLMARDSVSIKRPSS
jgi:hypothetical protein